MSKSIAKNLSLRQLSSLTLRAKEKGRVYTVMGVTSTGDCQLLGTITSSRFPSDSQILGELRHFEECVLKSYVKIIVTRRDFYRFASDFALEVSNAV